MYKRAHQLISAAIASIICTLLVSSIPLVLVLLACSYFISTFPDIDLKVGIKHRGKNSHSPFGLFAIITICLGVALFYVCAVIDSSFGYSVFGAKLVSVFPAFFCYLFTEPLTALFDPFLSILLVFYLSYITHLLLDSTTKSGISWTKESVIKGGYFSSDKKTNNAFILFGGTTFCLSIVFMIIKHLPGLSNYIWYYWYIVLVFSSGLASIIITSYFKFIKEKNAKCIDVDGNKICVKKSCLEVNGRLVCRRSDTRKEHKK